eukprot:jgi/Psemu1/324719/estExt_fgenesh1_pg.C_1730003
MCRDQNCESEHGMCLEHGSQNSPSIVVPDSPVSTPKIRKGKEDIVGTTVAGSVVEDMIRDDVEVSFSEALLKLSFNDRNAINDEIHGVSCMAPDESTPAARQFLRQVLNAMDVELNKIQDKPAFHKAQEMSQPYVNTEDFRLRFLRCELFDPKKAAQRMVQYLELVKKFYGSYALTRPIRLSDFDREDMAFLRAGDYQILPYRDRSGRRILCIVTNNQSEVPAKVRTRVLLYLWLVAAEDVESQRKGMVVISYSGPKITEEESEQQDSNVRNRKFHASRVTTHVTVASAVPMRCTAIHFCFPNRPIYHVLSRIYISVMSAYSSRVRFHLGENLELRYQLKSFGIPVELIPSTDTGNVKHVNLKQWIKLREFLERQQGLPHRNSTSAGYRVAGDVSSDSEDTSMDCEYGTSKSQVVSGYYQMPRQYAQQQLREIQQRQRQLFSSGRPDIVECPGSNDVIFRRGKSMTYHPGNVTFQSLIEAHLQGHTAANQAGKLAIVSELINVIRAKGGRFLTWDSKHSWWQDMMLPSGVPIPYATAHAQELEVQSKVNYAFRDFKKKMKTAQNLQITRSSTYAFERQDGLQRKRTKSHSACGGFGCGDNVVSDGGE